MTATVFIADDDLDDLEIFCEAVSEIDASIQTLTAPNGEVALKVLTDPLAPLPDFIFLDLNMPRMDGRKCLMEIKKLDRLRHIPVIVYSTSKLFSDIEDMRSLGAVYFITKPNRLSELRQVIGYVLNRRWEKINAFYR